MKFQELNFTSWPREQYRLSKQKWKSLQHRRVFMVTVISFIAIVVSVIAYYLVIPAIFDIIIIRSRQIRNGTDALEWWRVQQVPFITKVYVWNLTNPEEVVEGSSNPRLQEAGPYIFEQRTIKTPIEFKEDSIVYKEITTYHYRPDLTAPRSLDDTVVTLQAALYGAAVKLKKIAPSMMFMINNAIPTLFPEVDSIFVQVRVGDYLFDGLSMNCSSASGLSAALVCSTLPKTAPQTLRKLPNSTDYAFSFLHHKNYTELGPNEQNRGIKDICKVGEVMKVNNRTVLDVWQPGSQCNQLRGTDTLTFRPFITRDTVIDVFVPDICHSLSLHWQEETMIHGLTVYKFSPNDWLQSKENNTHNACFCMKDKERYCSNNGVRDISGCQNAPVVISNPHFLDADEEFREYAQGSVPDREKHLQSLYIEPTVGIPLKCGKRLQFNMPLMRIKGFNFVENVTEGLFPLLWIDETILVPSEKIWKINLLLTIQWTVNFITICVGSLMVKIFVCSLLSYLYLTKACCFHNITSDRVTALFHRQRRSSTEIAQTAT